MMSTEPPPPDWLTVHVGDRQLHFDTRSAIAKRWFFPRYASGTPHEPSIVDWLTNRLTPDTRFLDVGANVGFYTVLVSALCPAGRVVAVDVDPRLISEVLGNLAANEFDNAETLCGAAWHCDGELLAFEPEQLNNLSTNRIVTDRAGSTVGCVSFTIDSLCQQRNFHPTVVKIDVEGAEGQVIRGMKRTIQEISVLLLEVHPSGIVTMGEEIGEIYQALDSAGFACSLVEDHRGEASIRRLESADDWKAISFNAMVLCEKQAV